MQKMKRLYGTLHWQRHVEVREQDFPGQERFIKIRARF